MALRKCFRYVTAFFCLNLAMGCAAADVDDEVDDESIEFDEQIGETQQAVTQADKNWWKSLSQFSRNWEIMMRANKDKDKYVGLNCKMWAQKVVLDASHGVVSVPTTYPNAYGWQWNSSPYVQKLNSIYAAMYGDIVQMNIAAGPHTAIVLGQDGTNVCWIESNWNLDNTVHTRCQTIQQFLNSVTFGGVQKYTTYRITGG